MKLNMKKLTALTAAAVLVFPCSSITVSAAKNGSRTAAGLEDITSVSEKKKESKENKEASEQFSVFVDKEAAGTTGFAVCEDYVNIRSQAQTDSSIVGKIYSLGSVEIQDVDESGWYHVTSGNVEGYVSAEYIATGDTAAEIAADAGYTTAEVGAEILNIRADANSDSDIVAIAGSDDELEVVADNGDWIKVVSPEGVYGWVSCDYVYTSTEYATAVPVGEDPYVPSDEITDYYNADDQAPQQTDAAEPVYNDSNDYTGYTEPDYTDYTEPDYADYTEPDYTDYTEPDYTDYTEPDYTDYTEYSQADYTDYTDYSEYSEDDYTDYSEYSEDDYTDYSGDTGYSVPDYTSYASTGDAQADAENLYQIYLEAQNAADAAVANAQGEQAINDTAAAAQNAYAAYLTAQNAADQAWVDAQYQTSTDDGSYEETYNDSYDDGSYEETYDDSYDDGSYEETYDDSYDDGSYDDGSWDDSSYSTGASIASYACQFVGNPYVYGGSSLTGGTDCSGFTMSVYANYGISLPHSAEAQSGYGSDVSLDALQPGDLLFYYGDGGIGHVTMYIGNGQVVHASSSTTGIIISDVNYRTPCCARRLV